MVSALEKKKGKKKKKGCLKKLLNQSEESMRINRMKREGKRQNNKGGRERRRVHNLKTAERCSEKSCLAGKINDWKYNMSELIYICFHNKNCY